MQRLLNRRGSSHRPRLQRDNHSVRFESLIVWGDFHGENDPHAGAHQVVCQIRSAGKVICDAS
jgi:hypothetical protein